MAHFWSIYPNFWAKKFFPENPALSHKTSHGFLALCQNSEKTKDTIPIKRLFRRTDRRTEWRTDIYIATSGNKIVKELNMSNILTQFF